MSGGITFVDTLAPRAYSALPGHLRGLGGTEATLARIAGSLAPHTRVTVRQTARQGPEAIFGGVHYGQFDIKRPLPEAPEVIVVVNSWKVAQKLARLNPGSRVVVWQHVFPGRHNRALAPGLRRAGVEVVCVSAAQAEWLRGFLGSDAPAINYIHNPIADDLVPDNTPRDPDLLLFASSPHKGLAQVFRRFNVLKDRMPSLRLAVADPGYLCWPTGPVPSGVIPLGRLDQRGLIGWMRRALCLFYPQDHFAETFGLVIAEANAVGCPALLHRGLGANDEVASDRGQCIDTGDPESIAARIADWRDVIGLRPLATARPEFRLSHVAGQWAALLRSTTANQPRTQAMQD
ncbi:glycosyltransferase family 4 protein [Algicella marina]|uniref:Glycosyltransferase n=1 Tax=Algicella marina TaxID=2683284 RepID=A0A6P1T174_9RHOB|nr:glycosyltransferase family 4 protein [Algicella marina]QHQ35393.1 glycosyltransferase [Algicella marina]